MPTLQGTKINPALLAWARETAGFSPEDAALKFQMKDSKDRTAADKLLALERGEREISRSVLTKAASVYRRPLLAFYLTDPPARGHRGEDFRSAAGETSPRAMAVLDTLVRDVRSRQSLVRDVLLTEDEERRPLAFIGSMTMSAGATTVASAIRATLGVAAAEQQRPANPAGLFSVLRSATERAGIYVLLLGDLGSHHTDLDEAMFRGAAFADKYAPFVVINDNDAVSARSFTLIHELAHLWIGSSGISGPLHNLPTNEVERFCNDVAGRFLLPVEIPPEPFGDNAADLDRAMAVTNEIATRWNVSQAAVTYRLAADAIISKHLATSLFEAFAERWRVQRQQQRDRSKEQEGGPTYYIVRRARLGAGLLSLVREALRGDALTHTKAATILGVGAGSVNRLLQERPS